jgi:hypothetical protein
MGAQHPREQIGAGPIDHEASPDENLDETSIVCRHYEIASEGQVASDPCRRSIDRRYHGLVAIHDRSHEPLNTCLNHPGELANRKARPLRRRCSTIVSEIATSAEVPVPRSGYDDGPDGRIATGRFHQFDEPIALRRRDGVSGIRSVQNEPDHTVRLDTHQNLTIDA